jgi:glycine/D-amino acid oxidase-like deaminating enzyme
MRVDYIIVGQGLAGSALAMALLKRGKSLLVVDKNNPDSATRVAAGLVTTLAGKGMNPAWRQAEYLPYAMHYYQELEAQSGEQLFYPHPVLRLFANEKEARKFEKKVGCIQDWVADEDPKIPLDHIHGEHGAFEMARGGRLDTVKYLKVIRAEIEAAGIYLETEFDEDDLQILEDGVQWREYCAKKLIFCQGYLGLGRGMFAGLPHRCAKGEMLTVIVEQLDSARIINRNGWMVPLGNGEWRAGATYEWDDLTTEKTDVGRMAVEKKVKELTPLKFETLSHEVGVRPIVQNSQPVIGIHPEFSAIGIFNGLGSKGVITAPSVAEHFAAVLEGEQQLDQELSVERFLSESTF